MHSNRGSQVVYRHRAGAAQCHQQIELVTGESEGSKRGIETGDNQPGRARDMAEHTRCRIEAAFADNLFQRVYHCRILTPQPAIDNYLHMQLSSRH